MKPRGFHRSDFTGSEGAGLAKLRAAGVQAEPARAPKKKSAGLLELAQAMKEKRWEDAILLAARWSDLGGQAAAIQRGREAILRPKFQRQLKRDPARMIEEAKAALIERYSR